MALNKKVEKLPSGAVHFMEDVGDCSVKFDEDGKNPKINMVVYSGGIIKNHWMWGDLAIDLEGISFPKPKYPLLAQHDIERKLGWTGKPTIENGKLELVPEKTKFLDNDEAREFLENSRQDFPYQSSMYIPPTQIERVPEGESAEVNGFKLRGPGTVFRKSVFKEASVCVFGADSNTSASAAFSKEGGKEEIEYFEDETVDTTQIDEKEVIELKNAKEFEEKYPEIFKEVVETAQAAIKKDLDAATTTNTKLQETVTEQATKLEKQGEDIAELQKDKAIRDSLAEQAKIDSQADAVFEAKFEESNVPDNLKDKVRNMPCLNTKKFVSDGKLDETAFGEACENELSDWVSRGADDTIQGATFTSRDTETGESKRQAAKLEESDKVADTLLAHVGQPQKKD